MSLVSAYSTNTATLTSNNTIYVNQIVPRQITINPVANGYSISIGCQTFVFESILTMLSRIEEYYNDPAQVEQYFNEHKKLPNK